MKEPFTNHQTTTTVGQPTPLKPSYDSEVNNQGLQHSVTPKNPTAALLEVSDDPPAQDSLEKFERTPLQHQMLKAYLGNSPQQDSAYPSSANLPTPHSRHTGNFGSVLIPIQMAANISPHQVLHLPTAAGPAPTYYHSSFAQPPPSRQPDTSTRFLPAGRSNTYLSKLKKQVKTKKSTVTAQSKQDSKNGTPADPEEIQKGKLNMRKYLEKASQQTSGYNVMVSLNGGDCIGEQNLNVIERCIGISGTQSPNALAKNQDKKSPSQQQAKKENVLKHLQDEQREIEAKLKFIDSLINQQAPTSSYNVKYLGGGILKRQRTDDFVINLEQYQKAMFELKQTMDNLKVSTVEDDMGAADGEVEMYHRYQPVIAKSQYSDAQTENQTYQQQIEEALARQQEVTNSRQRLVVPPQPQQSQIIQGSHEDFDRSIMSNPSSNRLKQATLQRKSYDSNRFKDSFRSASFVLQNKLDNLGQPDTNFIPGSLSPDTKQQAVSKEITPEKGETGRERPQSCTLRVIKEVIINGRGEEEEIGQGDDQASNVGAGSKDGENNRYRSYQPNMPLLDMNKINMVFDQAAAPNGVEHTKQTLYDSKGFQARTHVNHPNFKGEKVGNHKGGILVNDEQIEEPDVNGDLMHIQNILPISKGLEIRPSKTPQTAITGELQLSPKPNERIQGSPNKRKHYQNLGNQNDRPTTVPEMHEPLDQVSEAVKKPMTSMGSTANHFIRSHSGLEKIEENVMYQQDEDNTRGVLYFKNLDSLKSFIMNKKRPIFSKQGDRIISNAVSISGSNWSSYGNLKIKKKPKGEAEIKIELEEDIEKKRQFLHRTLSTLMPQLQHKALLQQEKKLNFQQTIDFVQKRFFGASPPASAPHNGQQWAPISSQQQTLYNPIPKTSYLFDDIMTADGIIDLRFMVNSPGNTFYKQRLLSRQENVSSTNNLRSETSPGGIRKPGQLFPKRLQNFYQFTNLENYPQSQPQSKQGLKPGSLESRRKSRNTLGQAVSETLSDSQCPESSQNVTRQVVFFKTTSGGNPHNQRIETGGSYNMQYPHLRPRLNLEQGNNPAATNADLASVGKSLSKGASSLTVQHHQKYIKTGAVTTSSIVQIPTASASQTSLRLASAQSPEVVLNPSPNLLRMSKDIEKSKIRDSQQSFGLIKNQINDEACDKTSSVTDSIKLRDSRGRVPSINPIKHVIFSTYEGQIKGLQFAKNVRNLAGKKMPPLYPQVPGSSQPLDTKSSRLLSASDKQDEQGRNHAPMNFNTAFAAETQALTTAQSVHEGAAASLRSRAGTVSPQSRQTGQFFSNGGPGSLHLVGPGSAKQQSPHKKIQTQSIYQENRGDQTVKTAQSGNASKRGEILGSVCHTAGSNSSRRVFQNNKNYIKGLMHENGISTQSVSKATKAAKGNQNSVHHRMGLSITQSKFSNAQSV